MTIENDNGVHDKEKAQVEGSKDMSVAEKFSKFNNLDGHPYVESDKVEDVGRGRVTILQQ